MIKKIAITGPESTGKTSLTKELAQHYNDVWVPEYARDYIARINRPYNEQDLHFIAEGQINTYNEKVSEAKNFLFSDTELIVIKIWFENAYKHCPQWILDAINKQGYDLYLLCDIDLPWTYDPQREHPHLRKYFFDLYKHELEIRGLPYKIISGSGTDRLENAVTAVDSKFKTLSSPNSKYSKL